MSHHFQLRHMREHRQFAEFLACHKCVHGAHESLFSINAHVGPSTTCQIFGLQWMGAWKHMSHRFQLRHMCDHRQFVKSLACDALVPGSRSGKFPTAPFGPREPLVEEHWRHISVMASARGTVWSRQACCKRQRAAPCGHEASRAYFDQASSRRTRAAPSGHEALKAHFGHAAPLAEEQGRHLLGTSFKKARNVTKACRRRSPNTASG